MGTLPESVVNRLVSVNPRPSCAEADRGGGRRLPPLRGGDTRPRTCCSLPLTPPLMLPRTDCRKRSSSIRSLVLFENAMLGIATILPWERASASCSGREARCGWGALRGDQTQHGREEKAHWRWGTLAALGEGTTHSYTKMLLHCLAASPYNLESQASQTEDVQSLPKEIKQREIEVKKAGIREREVGGGR